MSGAYTRPTMKTEGLKQFRLSAEQIKESFRLNGVDVNAALFSVHFLGIVRGKLREDEIIKSGFFMLFGDD